MGDRTLITVICPSNDGESKTIVDICRQLDVDIRISGQSWGAVLDKEPEENLRDLKKTVVVVEMPSPVQEEKLRNKGHEVYVVDHHYYGKLQLDRRKPASSLEQVAEILGHRLNRWETGVAINDRSYIYGLIDAGYSEEEILAIRKFDLEAQGVPSQNVDAVREALASAPIYNGITILRMDIPVGGYAQDFLVLKTPEMVPDLLVLTGNPVSKVRFYGDPRKIRKLEDLGEWHGGSGKSGFWGTDHPNLEEILTRLNLPRSSVVQGFKASRSGPGHPS